MRNGIVILGMMATTCFTFASDLQVTASRKKISSAESHKSFHKNNISDQTRINPGVKGSKQEKVNYAVNVTNRSFSPMPELEARYIIFVERQQLGAKKGTEQVEKITGKESVAGMPAKGSTVFNTQAVKLREQSLSGNWIYSNGGRLKATDSIIGIWIKFFDGDTEVEEYVNPTTLANRHKWE